jgi:DNA-binding LacI/PurR family transcriptional regulator
MTTMATPRSRYGQIVSILTERLRTGVYSIGEFPGERKLASELGVSYMTARRAVQQLVTAGVLPRRPAGRSKWVSAKLQRSARLTIGYVAPAFSRGNELWFYRLHKLVERAGGLLYSVPYVNSHDVAITDALDGTFDGLFMALPANLPALLVDRIVRDARRVVMLFGNDLSDLGVPWVNGDKPESIRHVIEHLHQLGHRRVDCLNTQPVNETIQQRMDQWRLSLDALGMTGTLHDRPVEPFSDPDRAARDVLAAALGDDGRRFKATALFCTTAAIARGAYRALYEKRLRIGVDVSVCSCEREEEAELFTPSLTTLATPLPDALLRKGIDWIVTGGDNWKGPLRIIPHDVPLWVGESTGPAPAATRASTREPSNPRRQQVTSMPGHRSPGGSDTSRLGGSHA